MCIPILHNYTPCICGNYDVKDGSNGREFERQSYAVSVSEDSPIGSIFAIISADSGTTEGIVTYNITGGNEGQTFRMDARSGALSVAQTLDRERVPSYSLTVQASDGSLLANATVLITIEDVNDNVPEFDQPSYTVSVPEDSPIGSTVTIVLLVQQMLTAVQMVELFTVSLEVMKIKHLASIQQVVWFLLLSLWITRQTKATL